MSDESEPNVFLKRMRDFHALILAQAEALRGQGLEVDAFLADLAYLIADLEGRAEVKFDSEGMLARVTAFVEEMRQAAHLQRQADVVRELPGVLAATEKIAKHFHTLAGRMDRQSGVALDEAVARAREEFAQGKIPLEAMEDMALTLNSQHAEIARRERYRSVMLVLYWMQNPPERWAELSPENRAKMEELLTAWRYDREMLLSELPIEDRRRLEFMRGEDFDKPESWKP